MNALRTRERRVYYAKNISPGQMSRDVWVLPRPISFARLQKFPDSLFFIGKSGCRLWWKLAFNETPRRAPRHSQRGVMASRKLADDTHRSGPITLSILCSAYLQCFKYFRNENFHLWIVCVCVYVGVMCGTFELEPNEHSQRSPFACSNFPDCKLKLHIF